MGDDRDSDADELDRAAILRRRAVFVASAVAGLGLAASCGEASPAACLDIAPPPTATEKGSGAGGAPEAPPQPCLDVAPAPCLEMPMPADAGVQDTDAGLDGGPPPPTPQPCLRKAPPKPCLKMAPPKP